MNSTPSRAYSSELRTEQAASTRRRVLLAAAGLFVEQGYHGTSLAAVAKAARVSVNTVQATGAKRDLLLHAFELTAVDAEVQDPVEAPLPEVREALAAEDLDEFVVRVARVATRLNRSSGGASPALFAS